MKKSKHDLVGYTHERISVIEQVPRPKHLKQTGSYWLTLCSCGTRWIVHQTTILRGLKSCGCLGKEKGFKTKSIKHYRLLYNVWKAMHYRCYNEKNASYKDYGGRGIKIAKRWHDFSKFYNDMIDTYQRGLTIERINVDGDYTPLNCCWITNEAQALNRRSSLNYRAAHEG